MSEMRTKKELRTIIDGYADKVERLEERIRNMIQNPPETIKRVIVEHKQPPRPTEGYAELLNEHGYPEHRFSVHVRPDAFDTIIDLPDNGPGPRRQLRIRWQR